MAAALSRRAPTVTVRRIPSGGRGESAHNGRPEREDDVLAEDGKGPGVIENPLVRGAQARAYDTRELHAAEKRVEDRVRADEVYPVDGWALVCNHVLGMADWSGIHNSNSVYYTP